MPKEKDSAPFRFSPRPNQAHQIEWRPWGEDAFRLAREQNKPVFLSISAVWCHWCHVMDETNLSDEETIAFINHNFVPVRVDSDRRPDVNSRYNQGGWPSICFLTAAGEIIAGVTYVPLEQMRRLLVDVVAIHAGSPEQIEQAISLVRERRAEEAELQGAPVDASIVDTLADLAAQAYDEQHGGFGKEPKFPYVGVLKLLLARLAADVGGNEGEMLRTTLDAMAGGEIHDRIGGGFFRYATAVDWSHPHYEKMLEDNAELMAVFTEAYRLSGGQGYGDVVRDIHGYLQGVLLDPETGAFGGSQDADEDYYRLNAGDREKAAAPLVDRTVFSGWNATAASALLRAYQVFGDGGFRDSALRALSYVWENMWDGTDGPAHDLNGGTSVAGLLSDTAALARACLDAYESGAGDRWLDRATLAARWMIANLEDSERGGFYDCATAPGLDGYPSERNKSPVDNSMAAATLIRLAQNTGRKDFEEAAGRALKLLSGSFEQCGLLGADFGVAVMRHLDPPVRVTIVGPPAEQATGEMIRSAHAARIPFRSVEILDPEVHGEELESVGYGYEGRPIAYICVGASCQPPVDDPAQLPLRLESGWEAVRGQ